VHAVQLGPKNPFAHVSHELLEPPFVQPAAHTQPSRGSQVPLGVAPALLLQTPAPLPVGHALVQPGRPHMPALLHWSQYGEMLEAALQVQLTPARSATPKPAQTWLLSCESRHTPASTRQTSE
jgi:hypothetical protein